MATGIKIYNDAGTVQIDETYANLVLVDKATITFSMPGTGTYDYFCSGDVVAVAVKVWPETFVVKSSQYTGSSWLYRLSFFNNPETTGTCTFTVYAFGKPPTSGGTVGLKVQDASGNPIFHSEFKPLRIIAVNTNDTGYVEPNGRSVAAMFLSLSLYSTGVFPTVVFESDTLRISGNVIQSSRLVVDPGGIGLARLGSYAAVDVTHY